MNKYTATFSDGTTVSRKTNRTYAYAWKATWTYQDGRVCSDTGFSIDRDCKPYVPAPWFTGRGLSAKQLEENRRKNAELLAQIDYKSEIVPVSQS